MKVDRSKLKRSSSDVPADCKALIEKLKNCNRDQLLNELKQIKSWTCGKCELYHWVDLLDVFDDILGECCAKHHDNQWPLPCDSPDMDPQKRDLLMHVISFTALLIEHSFSRHLYSSMDHLITLLSSSDMQIVLSVLGLLFVFSKRSNFIGKLSIDKRQELITRLSYLAESWGGKENGFGLAECCRDLPMSSYPSSATTLHFEYYIGQPMNNTNSISNNNRSQYDVLRPHGNSAMPATPTSSATRPVQPPIGTRSRRDQDAKKSIKTIHIENVDQIKHESIAIVMERLVQQHDIPRDKQMQLFTHLRLAHNFSDPFKRMQCVQARLQAMSIIIYCTPASTQEIGAQLLYNGFIEELVDILHLDGNNYIDIKSAALRTLTAVVHLDRNSRLSTIIDATETSSYHGFLPVLVRNCIQSLINDDDCFPIPYATALFSFLYHLASYEKGGEALVSCGIIESLLKIISWTGTELEHITFVTRSVRVIDLITNIDMTVFQSQSGLNIFIERLEAEVKICRKELCDDVDDVDMNETSSDSQQPMDIDSPKAPSSPPKDIQCYTQRAALLKSMLNFLKKAIQDSTFSDCIRHIMDGSLPKSLRHIISNANYYGSSLFLLSIELVSAYVFQEPALLSSLQESQLTKDILDAILDKPLPPTREILAALPNTFSALCLNSAGLQAFQARKPFEKIFHVLISPEYLPAMRRRKADLSSDTATNLGNSMDELMRHQPSLRADVVTAIINLLKELCDLGDSPNYMCCTKPIGKSSEPVVNPVNSDLRALQQNNESAAVFSDEEDEDDEDSASPPVPNQSQSTAALKPNLAPTRASAVQSEASKTPVPLVDYIFNVMRFVDAILTNNSTDDHVREFLRQDGLVPLLRLMRLRNLPIDFPTTQACNGISSVCRSILALARDPKVVQEALKGLDEILDELQSLHKTSSSASCSVLLEEYGQVASSTNISDPNVLSNLTPALHSMSAAHAYIVMFSCINRSNHLETRNICINHWGKDLGLKVLEKMSKLYMALVWESTVLITITKGDRINVSGLANETDMDDSNQLQAQHQASTSESKPDNTNQTTQSTLTMDIDDTSKSSSDRKSKSKGKKIMVEQSKLIKPLLVSTSRLGKGLAELFALLVKLSVGSPLRHRRNNHSMQNTPSIPSSAAQNVASVFAKLIAEGLNLDSHSPPPKHWTTFFICFSGFTQTMLFDERKNPFHLMLRDLYKFGGLEAFFKTFEWFIAEDQRRRDDSNETMTHQTEFLDSWLSLLEKMVNPKMVLETPHAMAPKASTPLLEYSPFDPIQYLIVVLKRAFHCIDSLWRLQCAKYFSDQTSEHILSILCHILKGETIISEHLRKEAEGQAQSSTGQAVAPAHSIAPPQPNVNQDHLQQLVDMGFARDAVIDALMQCQSLVQATEFLLSAPQAAPAEIDTGTGQDVDMVPEDASDNKSNKTEPIAQQFEFKSEDPLSRDKIDTFTENLLPGSLRLMDELPSTVYKVCDLILTVAHRNGETWCATLLSNLLNDIVQNVKRLLEMAKPLRARDSKSVRQWASEMRNAPEANKVAVRIHLYSLLFDEMKIKCAELLHKSSAIDCFVELLEVGLDVFSLSQDDPAASTPKWLAPTILLIDLFEKGAVSSQRRAPLLNNQTRQWLYFDERTGRWTPHMLSNNKIIDDAYKNGEQYARYSVGRKHYIAQFSQMLQINEDTSNFRPIMMTLQPVADDSIEPNQENLVPVVEKLRDHQAKTLIRVCVGFMNLPIDSNSLQAIMRLTFRLTRDYELAMLFAEKGGVKALQNLPESSNFSGFVSLATLIIRHVIEEPAVLHQTMEKVIRSTTQHLQHNQREMHYLLRVLGSSACRNEETFKKLTTEILRIIPSSTNRRENDDGSARNKSDSPQLIKLLPPKSAEPVKPSPVTRCVISDLLDSLTIPIINKSTEPPVPSNLNNSPELNRLVAPTESEPAEKRSALLDSPPSQVRQHNPLLSHSIVLRLLAELTRSYSVVPKIIVDHVYTPSTSESIVQDVSALAYILDNILPTTQTHGDRDAPSLSRVFLASLAACNHCIEAQIAVVNEVKVSLDRAASLPENAEKHARLQALAAIIGTMIDCCPAISPQQPNQRPNSSLHQQQLSNNIVRLFVRKGLVTDLAKIPHSLDLSAPHMFATVNAILKPLEALSRFVNISSQPGQSRHHSSQAKKELICSSSSSSSGEDEETAENNVEEVSGVGDEREEDAEDEDDDEEEDDEDEHVDDDEDQVDDDEHVDNDEDHVDDDEDHVEDDVGDEDENLNAFGENQFADDYPTVPNVLNNVLNDIEEAFLHSNNPIYHDNRLNPVLPTMYTSAIDQHESAPPSLPPPPGNVGLTHPLLLRRVVSDHHGQIQLSGAPSIRQRYGRPRLLRGAAGAANSQWRHPSQTILQQLLGTNSVQEVMTLTNQIVGPGRLFVADFQNWLATDEELYPDHPDSHTLTPSHPSALSSIPLVMARWTDESRILDGGSLHDCLTNLKQEIVPILEQYEEEENQDRQEKRKKMIEDEERAQQKKCKEPQQQVDPQDAQQQPPPQQHQQQHAQPQQQQQNDDQTIQSASLNSSQAIANIEIANIDIQSNQSSQPISESVPALSQQSAAFGSDQVQPLSQDPIPPRAHSQASAAQQQQQHQQQQQQQQLQHLDQEHSAGEQQPSQPQLDQQQQQPLEQQQQPPPPQQQPQEQQPQQPEQTGANAQSAEGTSTTNMESEIPEGVDPSFLAALPEDIRQEVLAEQWRLRRLERANLARQNGEANTQRNNQASTSTGTTFPEVNPEFLAALPAEVQEEVLAQQRAEQQRQAATTANPDQPVDPAIFIQTLAPNLRRQVLADMDDSLLPLLPTDLATEAMVLRRELLTSNASANSTLSRLLRTAAAGRIQRARYTIAVPDHVHNHSSWSWALDRPTPISSSRNMATFTRDSKFKGRQLLDCEALTCLIILLFVQEPRLNISRLHRVLRNLSYHRNTRQWVVQSMLSIVDRARINPDVARNAITAPMEMQPQTRSSSSGSDLNKLNHNSSWLSISMDAALGCRASVFLAPKVSGMSSPNTSSLYSGRHISIHPQAAPAVCRHMLETLITLAKSFPEHFFPEALQINQDNSGEESGSNANSSIGPDFWDILAKLDSFLSNASSGTKRGRSSSKQSSSGTSVTGSGTERNANQSQVDGLRSDEPNSPLNKLMGFLAHPIIRRSPALTDRLLHLLAVISMSFPLTPSDRTFEAWSQMNSSRTGDMFHRGQPLHRSNQHSTVGHLFHRFQPDRHHHHQHHHHHRPSRPMPHNSNTMNNSDDNFNMIYAISGRRANNANSAPHGVRAPYQEPSGAQPMNVSTNESSTNQGENGTASAAQQSSKSSSAANKTTTAAAATATVDENKPKQPLVSQACLKLAVDVLTSKSCSEEGLDDVTTLLSRLSASCSSTRTTVLDLLMEGARQLGHNVCQHISTLKDELGDYNQKLRAKQAATSADSLSPNAKGVVQDRFTNESVIITAQAAAGSKGGREVQLPSMAALTSKNSSQAFFLRILKVVIQLRDTYVIHMPPNIPLPPKLTSVIAPPVHQNADQSSSASQPTGPTPPPPQLTEQHNIGSADNGPQADQMDVDTSAISSSANNTEDLSLPSVKIEDAQAGSSTGHQNVACKAEESLSIELQLDDLWETLSECLLELADTPDHHAVLVLQPAVEAFFLVHSPGFNQRAGLRHLDENSADKNSQTAHIDQEVAPISPAAADHTNQGASSGFGLSDGNNSALGAAAAAAAATAASGPASSSSTASQCGTGAAAAGGSAFDTQKFLHFAETHRVVLNHILRQSTTPLSQGPFAVLVDHTRVLDFDVKRRYFRQELERLDEGIRRDDLGIHVRRENVFEESFRELHRRSAEDWKNRFFVVFEEEEGQDAGGLLREWYTIISREIFNPMYALFTTSPGDRVTYMINSASHCNTNHLTYFKFVGRVIAKAIYDNKLLDCYFTRSFYKHILGKPVKYTDMESEDYSFYQGLVFLLEHGVKELGYELTFSVEVREFGVTEVRELKPNGSNIPVTEENKHEYVRLVCQEKMTGSIRKQLNAFLEGFYDIIPKRLISIFNEQELELLISGLPNIDIDDLKASTEYHKYLPNSLQIQWFWRALRSFDQADRAKLLQFVTGTSKVPLQGFSSLEGMNGVQKFQIHRDERSTDRLPSAHTCFNQLDLPVYETYDKLRYMLLKAIRECSEGFGLA